MSPEKEPQPTKKELNQEEAEKLLALPTQEEAELTLKIREKVKRMDRDQLLEAMREAERLKEAIGFLPQPYGSVEYASLVEKVKLISGVLRGEFGLLFRSGKIKEMTDGEVDRKEEAAMMMEDEAMEIRSEERLRNFIEPFGSIKI